MSTPSTRVAAASTTSSNSITRNCFAIINATGYVPLMPQADKAAEEPKEDRVRRIGGSEIQSRNSLLRSEEAQAASPHQADAGLSGGNPRVSGKRRPFCPSRSLIGRLEQNCRLHGYPAEDRMDEADPMTLVPPGASLKAWRTRRRFGLKSPPPPIPVISSYRHTRPAGPFL